MVHLTVPGLADYRERIALYFDDAVLELVFPSPWLNHQPTELRVRRSDGMVLQNTETRSGFEEAYIRELEGFWSAIVEGTPLRTPFEQARRDQALLCGLARRAAGAV
jgi:predicted dehydrogenase